MTLLWDVQAAVKAALDAALAVPVYDIGELVGDDAREYVTVGNPAENGDTATSDLEPSSLGNRWADESGEVPCMIDVWDGSGDIATLRATAKPLLAACTAAIKADPTLGGLLVAPGLARVSAVRLREGQTQKGARVQAGFTVSYSALLT